MAQRVMVVEGREPEGRIDPLTGSEVIISAARSVRENGNKTGWQKSAEIPLVKPTCPFCPGNEEKTPEEVVRIVGREPGPTGWTSRAFPNLFPALALEAKGPAFGIHEVTVETWRHSGMLSSLSESEIADAFLAMNKRYFDFREDDRFEWFFVFKNLGELAGASQEHPHFQHAAKSEVPNKFWERFVHAQNYFRQTKSFLCCDQIDRHRNLGQVVLETEYFILFVPFEARMPYHMRLFPKRHSPSFAHTLSSESIRLDFAAAVRRMMLLFKIAVQGSDYALYTDPMYNLYIQSAPYRYDNPEGIHHWHLEFHGKTTIEAGYEKCTGEFINPTYPEEIAKQLQEIGSQFPSDHGDVRVA